MGFIFSAGSIFLKLPPKVEVVDLEDNPLLTETCIKRSGSESCFASDLWFPTFLTPPPPPPCLCLAPWDSGFQSQMLWKPLHGIHSPLLISGCCIISACNKKKGWSSPRPDAHFDSCHSSGFRLQRRRNSWPYSWIHLFATETQRNIQSKTWMFSCTCIFSSNKLFISFHRGFKFFCSCFLITRIVPLTVNLFLSQTAADVHLPRWALSVWTAPCVISKKTNGAPVWPSLLILGHWGLEFQSTITVLFLFNSWMHPVLPHLSPTSTGQPACSVSSSPWPFLWRFHQKMAAFCEIKAHLFIYFAFIYALNPLVLSLFPPVL